MPTVVTSPRANIECFCRHYKSDPDEEACRWLFSLLHTYGLTNQISTRTFQRDGKITPVLLQCDVFLPAVWGNQPAVVSQRAPPVSSHRTTRCGGGDGAGPCRVSSLPPSNTWQPLPFCLLPEMLKVQQSIACRETEPFFSWYCLRLHAEGLIYCPLER